MSPYDVLEAQFVAEARTSDQVPGPTVAEIAFAGRSNVGKSTLLNAVCQRKGLARTSGTPGCTRGIVFFDLRLRNGVALRLVDLPGYGFAERSKSERRAWGALIEKYLSRRPTLRGVLLLVDARRGPEAEENTLMDFLRSVGVPYVLVITKIDKLSRAERGVVVKRISQQLKVPVVAVSGQTGEGRDDLLRVMLRLAVGSADAATSGSVPG